MRDFYVGEYPTQVNGFTIYVYPLEVHGNCEHIQSVDSYEAACDAFKQYCAANKSIYGHQADVCGPNGFRKRIF